MRPVHQSGGKIFGRVYYGGRELYGPGWVLQYYDSGQIFSVDLGIEVREAVLAAVADAAEYLCCRPENIQVAEGGLIALGPDPSAPDRRVSPERGRKTTTPCARLYFARDDVLVPGWYIQFQTNGRLDRYPLWQRDPEDPEAARTEAAWLLGCHPEEIEVGGELLDWPSKRRPR